MRSNAAQALYGKKSVLDKITRLVKIFVVTPPFFPIAAGRNYNLHTSVKSICDDLVNLIIAVIAVICQ